MVSKIFYFHPYLGKIPILTNIFQRGWNHQLDEFLNPPSKKRALGIQRCDLGLGVQAEPEKKKSPWLDVGFAQGKATPFVFVGNVEGGNRKIQKKKLHLKIKMHIETHRFLSSLFFWAVCVFWVLSKIQHTMNYECFKQWQAECSNIGKRNQQGFDQGGLGGLTSVMKSRFYINGNYSRWWLQIFFIFTPIWGRFPIWLIFFRWVETTNQLLYFIKKTKSLSRECHPRAFSHSLKSKDTC